MALFVQAMLSKVDDARVTIKNLVWSNNTVIEYSGTVGVEASSPYKDISISATNLYYEIGTYHQYSATWVSLNNKTKNTKIIDIGAWQSTQTRNITGSLTKDTNDILTFKFDGSSGQYGLQKINYARFYTEQYIYKSYNIKGLPRELKIIGNKATITLFGVHTDNERIEDFKGALSTNFEYVASKGEAHKTTSVSTTSYTAIGYGYCRYDVRSNGNEGYVKLNGIKLGYVSESGAHLINLIFFKPGDILEFNLLYSLELVDYY